MKKTNIIHYLLSKPNPRREICKMRARHVLDALDRVALFRSQAEQQAHRGRVEEIGDDLDSALSLLDLRQSRQQFRDDICKTGGEMTLRFARHT